MAESLPKDDIEVRRSVRAELGYSQEQDPPTHKAFTTLTIVEAIISHLKVADLKSVRLLNHLWRDATHSAWVPRSEIVLKDPITVKKFCNTISSLTMVRDFKPQNWTFQGETVNFVMNDAGHYIREILKPLWPSVQTLTFSNWMVTRVRREQVPRQLPTRMYMATVKVNYELHTTKGSTYQMADMLKLCVNLRKLTLHYPVLVAAKGVHHKAKYFPVFENLTSLEIYFEGKKWSVTPDDEGITKKVWPRLWDPFHKNIIFINGSGPITEQTLTGNTELDPNRAIDRVNILRGNIQAANLQVPFPSLPERNGGNVLLTRILDHSPNLASITVTTGTILSTQVEKFFLFSLLDDSVKLPNLVNLKCSIPMQPNIGEFLKDKHWNLNSLYLRIVPAASQVSVEELHALLASLSNTLQHLELVFMTDGPHSSSFPSSNKLVHLRSLELWGYSGDYDFLKDLASLRKAVIGVTEWKDNDSTIAYFELNSFPPAIIEIKSPGEFTQKLNEGPK